MLNFINNLINIFGHFGYQGIVFLMALESSIIPVPSELVIPPAGILAARGEMNLLIVIIAGVAGSLIGAILSYWVSWLLGRAVILILADHKIAKILQITPAKVEKAEKFFLKYGSVSVFVGRLLPVIRHLISIPAGFSKMNFSKFVFYTFAGSAIWVTVLAVGGYYLGAETELIAENFKMIVEVLIIVAILAGIFYWIYARRQKIRGKLNANLANDADAANIEKK
ncbi:MAG: DedA family protein [Patescibacteria group bacterium]|nr:DedA family protein [Patescibacteria group bacterium]